jgi:hypothetical protein
LRILGRASAQVNAEQAFTFAARAGKPLKIVSIKPADGKPRDFLWSLIRRRSIQENRYRPYCFWWAQRKAGADKKIAPLSKPVGSIPIKPEQRA